MLSMLYILYLLHDMFIWIACESHMFISIYGLRSHDVANHVGNGVQAMDLISVAQQTGDVSMEMYAKLAANADLTPPLMEGIDALVASMTAKSANPFTSGAPTVQLPPSPVSLQRHREGEVGRERQRERERERERERRRDR